MTKKLLYTYAMAKTLYEKGRDYIDSFWPFVLKVLPENKNPINLGNIQKNIKERFGLEVPEHSLKVIITRAKRKKFVAQERKNYKVTNRGLEYLDQLEPESEVNRRINELLKDIKSYLDEEIKISLDEIYKIILSFVKENIYLLVEFFDYKSSGVQLGPSKKKFSKYENMLIRYFEVADKQKPDLYKTLQDIVYGSVISTVTGTDNIAEINKKFKCTQVFLDSNFIFSILDLHSPEFNKPAKELFQLLKLYKFEIKVLDFTIEEMVRVLMNYLKEHHMYVAGIRVDSIYSRLKSLGWSTEDLKEFIQKIDVKVLDLGITIEPTTVEVKNYTPQKEEYLKAILRCKPFQNEQGRNHDIAAIEQIEKIRGSAIRQIESSKALFLTSDIRLSNCNFLKMGHKEKATVCEVLPDRLLTNILWLKNPSITKDIPLKSIIAVHSRDMFIDKRVWRKFYENVAKLKENGRVNDKDLAMLFYNHYIEEVLSIFDESDVDKVTPELILEEIAKMSKTIDKDIQKKLREQKEIFESETTQKKLEQEKKWEREIGKIKEQIRTKSERKANVYVSYMSGGIALIIVVSLFIIIKTIISAWKTIEPFAWAISFIISILSLLGIEIKLGKIRKRLELKIFNKIFRRSINELKLKE